MLYNPPDPWRSVISFSRRVLFRAVFCQICFQFRSAMVSKNKGKGPFEEDIQDPELKEEVESEGEGEV